MKLILPLFIVLFSTSFLNAQDVTPPEVKAKSTVTLELGTDGTATLAPKQVDEGSSDDVTTQANLQFSLSKTSFNGSDLMVTEEWQLVGEEGISASDAHDQSLAIGPNGTAYVAYMDIAFDWKTTVLKWNGSGWEALGGEGVSAGEAHSQSLAVAPDGTPYVAYKDVANGSKTTVLKWNGSSWEAVGGAGISAGEASHQSLAIAPNGNPLVAYFDVENGSKTTVLKWNGSGWEALGGEGVSAGEAHSQSLAVAPDGTPYVAYKDVANGSKTTVLKWNGSSWEAVGGAGISGENTYEQSLAIAPNGTPYVAYRDDKNGKKITVLMWNGSNWETIGGEGVSSGEAYHQHLAISPDGSLFLAFQDIANGNQTTVLKWSGNSWESISESGFSSGEASNQSLAIAPDGTPFVAYRGDIYDNFRTTVKKYYQSNRVIFSVKDEAGNKSITSVLVYVEDRLKPVVRTKNVTLQLDAAGIATLTPQQVDNGSADNATSQENLKFSLSKASFSCADMEVIEGWKFAGGTVAEEGYGTYQSLAVSSDGTPYVAFMDYNHNGKTTVLRGSDNGWEPLGGFGISSGEAEFQDIAVAPDGTPYVAYTAYTDGGTTVLKWNGSSWVPLAEPGMYGYFLSIAIAPSGTLFLSYSQSMEGAVSVLKWTGSSWEALGGEGISAGATGAASLAVAPDDTPYVAYRDETNENKTTVLRWTGSSWEALGGEGISAGAAGFQQLSISPDGIPVVAYRDETNGNKTTVLRWTGSSWEALGGEGISAGATWHQSLAVGPDGAPYLAYTNTSDGYKASVLKWTGTSWELLAGTSISNDEVAFLDLSFAPDGTPLLAYQGSYYEDYYVYYTAVRYPYQSDKVSLSVEDEAGNVSTATATVTVEDRIAPSLEVQDVKLILDAEGNATLTEAEAILSVADNCSSVSISFSRTSFTCQDSGSPVPVTVTAKDASGNSTEKIIQLTVADETAPAVLVQDITIQLDMEGNAFLRPEQVDNGSFDVCGIAGLSLNKTSFSCSDLGNNTLTLTVTDVHGNSSTASVNIKVEDKLAPVMEEGQRFSLEENSAVGTVVGSVIASDNCSRISWSITGGNPENAFAINKNGLVSVNNIAALDYETTPEYVLSLSLKDEGNNVSSGTFTILLTNQKDAPVLSPVEAMTVQELEPVSFTAVATDQDNTADELQYRLGEEAPQGSSIDAATGVFSWTPAEEQGPQTYIFRLMVSDGELSSEQEISIDVTEVNQAPVITSEPATKVKVGEPYTYQLIASDADLPANTLQYEALEFPSWLSFNAETLELTGTPDESLQADAYLVRLQVGDGTEQVVQEFSIQLEIPTGIFGKEVNHIAKLYPNPTSGRISIELEESFKEEELSVSLFDGNGRLLMQGTGSLKQVTEQLSTILERAKAGMYLLRLKARNQINHIRINRL